MTDLLHVAQQAIDDLTPILQSAEPLANKALGGFASTAGGKLLTWLTDQFQGKPAAATLDRALADPTNPHRLNALQGEIADLAEHDPTFLQGLTQLLQAAGHNITNTTQTATASGNAKITQIHGNHNTTNTR